MSILNISDVHDKLQRISEEGIYANFKCLQISIRLCDALWADYGILPKYIAESVEHGIFMSFNNKDLELNVELYNDETAAYVVCVDKNITDSGELNPENLPRTIWKILKVS